MRLCIPRRWWDDAAGRSVERGGVPVALPAALDHQTLLARPGAEAEGPTLEIAAGPTPQPFRMAPGAWRAGVVLHAAEGAERVVLSAQAPDGTPVGVDELFLPGAENRRLPAPPLRLAVERERWSRSEGAIGPDTWGRLQDARVVIVGVGRTGSLAADALAGAGVERLTLVDPDIVEPHNVGEGVLYRAGDLRRLKAEAAAEVLDAQADRPVVRAASVRADAWPTVAAVSDADLVVACVDNEAARRTVGALAALFHRPLVDVGTGVLAGAGGPVMGFDVRLVVPGDGCAACWAPLEASGHADGVRLGSLRSVNTAAVGVALRLVEDLYRGAVGRSQHVRGSWEGGRLHVEQRGRDGGGGPGGCFCAHAGRGARGLSDIGRLARSA